MNRPAPRPPDERREGGARWWLRWTWIVSHVFVLAIVVIFVSLGFWQLRRLDEVQARNVRLAARLAQPEVPLAEVVGPDATGAEAAAAHDRRVTVTGRYRPEEQVLIRGRSLDDAPGSWIVVPLALDGGEVVAVNRGWIRNDGRYTAVPATYDVPDGEVTVTGLVQPSQERGTLGATDPAEGRLDSLARVDLERLDQQVEGELAPVWIQMTEPEAGAPDPSPEPLDPPVVNDEGSHLSYAVQWFIFATIAVVGYPMILRKVGREKAVERDGEAAGAGPDPDEPGPDEPDPDDEPAPGDPRLDAPHRR